MSLSDELGQIHTLFIHKRDIKRGGEFMKEDSLYLPDWIRVAKKDWHRI